MTKCKKCDGFQSRLKKGGFCDKCAYTVNQEANLTSTSYSNDMNNYYNNHLFKVNPSDFCGIGNVRMPAPSTNNGNTYNNNGMENVPNAPNNVLNTFSRPSFNSTDTRFSMDNHTSSNSVSHGTPQP